MIYKYFGYAEKIASINIKAAEFPSGKNYENVQALCDELINHVMRVTADHDEYNGQIREIVKFMNESKFPECRHVYKDKPTVTADTVAQKPAESFVGTQIDMGNLSDFEEILSDGDVPF